MQFNIIVAKCLGLGIGKDNNLPWNETPISEDMKMFKQLTTYNELNESNKTNIVIMGRKTYESIPKKCMPLSNRINIVLSNTLSSDEYNLETYPYDMEVDITKIYFMKSMEIALKQINIWKDTQKLIISNKCFIIGGEQLYSYAFNNLYITNLYVTDIYKKFECDTFLPDFTKFTKDNLNSFKLYYASEYRTNGELYYRFNHYMNINSGKYDIEYFSNKSENEHLQFMQDILKYGEHKEDRTNTGIISLFAPIPIKYNLRNSFPLSTTKRMFFRAIFEELMLYLRGQTDAKILSKNGIHIWDGNTTREFLDKRGLTEYEEGDMGATYGFNMRHYGDEYKGCHSEHTNGFDQLEYVINLIKNDPTSRRILINLWNPSTIDKSALPSCLCQYQFYVNTRLKELDLQIYIRSSDVFLANNWNVCTGGIFVHLLCNLEGIDLTPGTLTVVCGDAHIYKNHVDAVNEQLKREPYPYPKLIIKNKKEKITDFNFKEDLELIGYKSHPNDKKMKVEMAV